MILVDWYWIPVAYILLLVGAVYVGRDNSTQGLTVFAVGAVALGLMFGGFESLIG